MVMSVRLTTFIVIVVLACVLMAFISPAANLPRTALRAQKLALLTMLALVAAATAILLYTPLGFRPDRLCKATRPQPPGFSVARGLGCVLRC
jgi:hypothetical protein